VTAVLQEHQFGLRDQLGELLAPPGPQIGSNRPPIISGDLQPAEQRPVVDRSGAPSAPTAST
jgi:hypothetical protein